MARRNRIVTVRVGDLEIHPEAQRSLVPAQLKKRMADIDLDAIGVLHGVEIGGQVYIIDGQHRVVALKRHGFDDWRVQVMLHDEAADKKRAHALFLSLNARTSPSAFDTYRNELGAGLDIAVGVERIATHHNIKIDRQSGDGHASCVGALKAIYERDAGTTLADYFEIATAAHGTTASAFEGKYAEGLAMVLAANNGTIDRPALVKKLSKYPGGASGVLGDAKGLKKIRKSSLARCVAETIIEAYNTGRREPNRLPLP